MKLESFNRFKGKNEIDSICKKYGIKKYTINDDLSIDVNGDVNLSKKGLTKLPLKFRHVSGNFYCSSNKLTSLEGSPQTVEGSFYCDNNQLTTLEGSPQKVGGDFFCYDNKLKDVKGFPERFYGEYISISDNPIEEIFNLFPGEKWAELPESLNEHDPIRGSLVILQRLEQCFYDLGLKIPENIKFKNYEVREF